MLSESFIAASSAPPKLTSSQSQQLKDAGVFCHSFQPQARLEQSLKKSTANANGVACTDTHIFAAQAGKAAVHVYSRDKGNQEATVQFPEKICSLTLALEGTLVVLGGEGGGLHLWETCTGRHVPTAQAHLQSVTVLASSAADDFVLSGSEDSNIHVWSLISLLSLPSHGSIAQGETKTPQHTLSGHREPITAIVMGHSKTNVDIAISSSKDDSIIVWNYKMSLQLRTILLSSAALCLSLDPGDRGLYAGLVDGTIQIIDFFAQSDASSVYEVSSTPIQPNTSGRISQSSTSPAGSILSLALSYDSTTLVSGHMSGKILSWDVGRPAFSSQIAEYPAAPITNLQFLPPGGFHSARSSGYGQQTIVKPRMNDAFSGPRGGSLTGAYALSMHFVTSTSRPHEMVTEFERALRKPIFSHNVLEESISGLRNPPLATAERGTSKTNGELDGSQDFVSLGSAHAPTAAEELVALRSQVEHLTNTQRISFRKVGRLMKDKEQLRKERDEAIAEEDRKELEVQNEAVKNWGRHPLNGESVGGASSEKDTAPMRLDSPEIEDDGYDD